jgi:hypothetical protein
MAAYTALPSSVRCRVLQCWEMVKGCYWGVDATLAWQRSDVRAE